MNKKNMMKQQPSAMGARFSRLVQAATLLAAIKLAAICLLWNTPGGTESPMLEPVTIRPAMAASASPATNNTASQATQHNSTATAGNATQPKSPSDQAQDLKAREQALDKREAELRALELELDDKFQKLRAMEVKMQKMIDSAGAIQNEKMQHLVDVYSNMKPKQAAQVLETLEESIAVKILSGMSGRKAGEILSSVRPDRAAKLSEALTKLQTSENRK